MLVYKGVVFILDPLNCFISKITSLLFTSTIQIKAVNSRAVVHLMRPFSFLLFFALCVHYSPGWSTMRLPFKIQYDVGEVSFDSNIASTTKGKNKLAEKHVELLTDHLRY